MNSYILESRISSEEPAHEKNAVSGLTWSGSFSGVCCRYFSVANTDSAPGPRSAKFLHCVSKNCKKIPENCKEKALKTPKCVICAHFRRFFCAFFGYFFYSLPLRLPHSPFRLFLPLSFHLSSSSPYNFTLTPHSHHPIPSSSTLLIVTHFPIPTNPSTTHNTIQTINNFLR